MHTRWNPVIKRGGLGSNYQEGGTINWFNTATYFTCPNLGHDIGTSYIVSLVEQELLTLLEHLMSLPIFIGIRVTWSLVLCVCCVDLSLSLCTFSFGHCVVCYFSIYGFWLPLCYLQTLLKLRGVYSFCWYWWNWWPSLLRLSTKTSHVPSSLCYLCLQLITSLY